MGLCLGRGASQLDSTRLAATAHQDLSLDDNRPADSLGDCPSLRRTARDFPRERRNAARAEKRLSLILVQVQPRASCGFPARGIYVAAADSRSTLRSWSMLSSRSMNNRPCK